jgi:K319-like protein
MTTKSGLQLAMLLGAPLLALSCQGPPEESPIDTTDQATTSCGTVGASCCSSNKCNSGLKCSNKVCLGPYRPDYLAIGSSGTVSMSDGKSIAHPAVNLATFVIRNEDNGCKPSSSKSCHFTVESVRVELGAYDFGNLHFAGATIHNGRPFFITAKPSGSIPTGTPFLVGATLTDGTTFSDPQTMVSGAKVTLDLSGQGSATVAGTLKKKVGNDTLTTTFSVSAALASHPPVANAGKDFSISGPACDEPPFFDGSGSSDPDGDIVSFDWYDDGVLAGSGGDGQNLPVFHRGVNTFTLKVTDESGGEGIDTVKVTANCPSMPAF